jgi:hypothetical protein
MSWNARLIYVRHEAKESLGVAIVTRAVCHVTMIPFNKSTRSGFKIITTIAIGAAEKSLITQEQYLVQYGRYR